MNPALTLRTGLAWEKSPIQNPNERTVPRPNSDRSGPASARAGRSAPTSTIDLAYTHIFVDDAQIDRTEFVTGLGNVRLLADVDASVDIVSLGFKYKWGGRAEPLK